MRCLLPLLFILVPLSSICQKNRKKGPSEEEVRTSLIQRAEVATAIGDLDSADVLLAEALRMWPDPSAHLQRANVLLLKGDTAGYCRYVPIHRKEDAQRKASFDLFCTSKDSVPFERSGLSSTAFPGIKNVSRQWMRDQDQMVHRLYDEQDSLRVGFACTKGDTIFFRCDKLAVFPGGESEMFKYLGRNTRYPEMAVDAGIVGKVYTTFVVGLDGSLENITLRKGVHHLLDEESLRVIRSMPAWEPASYNGTPVRFRFDLPVRFVLR